MTVRPQERSNLSTAGTSCLESNPKHAENRTLASLVDAEGLEYRALTSWIFVPTGQLSGS